MHISNSEIECDLTFFNKKLCEGDTDTYVFLFRKYYIPLCAYSRRYVGRKDVAEEIVSDTFFNIWNNRTNIEIKSTVKGYLFQAVCNNSLNYLRKLKKEDRVDDFFTDTKFENINFAVSAEDIPSESMILNEMEETIENAVNLLPTQQQTVFKLKRYEGKKNREIAEEMGLSIKTVEMHLSKAMVTLRTNLKEYLPEFLFFMLFKDLLQ